MRFNSKKHNDFWIQHLRFALFPKEVRVDKDGKNTTWIIFELYWIASKWSNGGWGLKKPYAKEIFNEQN